MYVHTHIYTHTRTYTHIHVHTDIQTHSHTHLDTLKVRAEALAIRGQLAQPGKVVVDLDIHLR